MGSIMDTNAQKELKSMTSIILLYLFDLLAEESPDPIAVRRVRNGIRQKDARRVLERYVERRVNPGTVHNILQGRYFVRLSQSTPRAKYAPSEAGWERIKELLNYRLGEKTLLEIWKEENYKNGVLLDLERRRTVLDILFDVESMGGEPPSEDIHEVKKSLSILKHMIEEGRRYERMGEVEKAYEKYAEAEKYSPLDPQAPYLKALLLGRHQRIILALSEMEEHRMRYADHLREKEIALHKIAGEDNEDVTEQNISSQNIEEGKNTTSPLEELNYEDCISLLERYNTRFRELARSGNVEGLAKAYEELSMEIGKCKDPMFKKVSELALRYAREFYKML